MINPTRRQVLWGMGAATAALSTGALSLRASSAAPLDLLSRETSYAFGSATTQGLVSVADNAPPPVIRLRQGEPAVINLTNGLEDYTTMHWHGIRLPNAMDGVPYLTQFPIAQDETFRYAYTPPDAGTYWYHPHCMTMRQMAQGLTGLLVVEEAEDPGFDVDLPLNLKDFRLDADGQLLPYFTPRGAARAGTLGNLLTTNWQVEPVHDLPAGGLVRLRFAATGTTRTYRLAFPDIPGRIIAWDGHPVEEEIPWPTQASPLLLAAGQRVDVALRMPDQEGAMLSFLNAFGGNPPSLVTLRATGPSLGRDLAELKPLPRNPISVPDLANAELRELVLGWSPDDAVQNNGYCGTLEYTFWSIDRKPWPGDAVQGVGPVAELELGKSYVMRLHNESPNLHPIHLHGLLFKPIRSNQRVLPANYTDTILLRKNEIVDIAFVADNPGDWAFHCHVIEHQKTGLAGYVRVS
ncbi:MAG: multicopper oxidase family protein [Pseudomonadota bacterium]